MDDTLALMDQEIYASDKLKVLWDELPQSRVVLLTWHGVQSVLQQFIHSSDKMAALATLRSRCQVVSLSCIALEVVLDEFIHSSDKIAALKQLLGWSKFIDTAALRSTKLRSADWFIHASDRQTVLGLLRNEARVYTVQQRHAPYRQRRPAAAAAIASSIERPAAAAAIASSIERPAAIATSIERPGPFDDTPLSGEEKGCVVCNENRIATVITDCGHSCLCGSCANKVEIVLCPMCRVRCTKIIRVYLA